MNKILIILLVCWGAGCTQQREEVEVERERFDPAKHYIVSIDTVEATWEHSFTGRYDTVSWDSGQIMWIDPIYRMTTIYKTETTFASLKLPLFTPEELKKIKEMLAETAP